MISRRRFLASSAAAAMLPAAARAAAAPMPIFDAHIHFSHDAAELLSADEAVAILERAGLKRALVSSSGDAGTRALHAAAPDLVLPSLRPYRRRGETGSWVDDPSVIDFLEDRLTRFRWVAVGEFHLFAPQTDKAVPRRMIELARQHNLLLHAHSDAGAVDAHLRPVAASAGAVGPCRLRRSGHRRPDARASMRTCGPTSPTAANTPGAAGSTTTGGASSRPFRTGSWSAATRSRRSAGTTSSSTPSGPGSGSTDLPSDLAGKIAWRNGEAMIRPAPGATCVSADGPVAPRRNGAWRPRSRSSSRPARWRPAPARRAGPMARSISRQAVDGMVAIGTRRHRGRRAFLSSVSICAGRRDRAGPVCAAGCRTTGTA